MFHTWRGRFIAGTVWCAILSGAAAQGPGTSSAASKPLILFVGDSITSGTPSAQTTYRPSAAGLAAKADLEEGNYGYYDALVEATASKDVPFRFRKIGLRGQALTGSLGLACRQVLERRHRTLKELPAYLIVQDYFIAQDGSLEELDKALRQLAEAANKARVKIVFSTVTTDPRGSSPLKAKDEDVQRTNALILKTAKEVDVPVVRLDLAWERYEKFAKGKEPARDWILTNVGKRADGVHPGPVGALLQALVFARELGIPPGKFDETIPELGVPEEQAVALKKLVYSWVDPTVIPLPQAATTDKK